MFSWLINTLCLMFSAWIVPGIHLDGFWTAVIAVLVIGLINLFLRPILILLTLPATLLTLGIFVFVINGLLFWAAGSNLVDGFHVDGFTAAFFCSAVYVISSSVVCSILGIKS